MARRPEPPYPTVLDQAFLVEKRLAPARDCHLFEQAGLGEWIIGNESFGFLAIIGINNQKAAIAAGAVILDQRAGRKQKVLLAGEVFDMRRPIVSTHFAAAGFVLRLDGIWHFKSPGSLNERTKDQLRRRHQGTKKNEVPKAW